MTFRKSLLAAALAVTSISGGASAETRLMRQPDIHGATIVFVYGGDLWSVPRTGGSATRITTDVGIEQYPMISPDGKSIAFTAEYDGNADLFTVPITGGEPTRLTYHPFTDRTVDWYPDGKSILIRSTRQSPTGRYERYFKVPAAGGFAEMLPLPTAGPATWRADGKALAYNLPSMENRTWKRYQGGSAPEVWIYDFEKNKSEKLTDWTGTDEMPLWYKDTIYFNSDRTGKLNLWAYDLKSKAVRQITKYTEFDVKWPALGPDAIVFENGGRLRVMDLPSEEIHEITVDVPTDRALTRAEYRNAGNAVQSASISPGAMRVAVEARGDIITVPAKKGTYRPLTATPGVHERSPSWSPDGRWVACWSDASGEYEIQLLPQDGNGAPRELTKGVGGYGFDLRWSPDSKSIAWIDESSRLRMVNVASGKVTDVDSDDIGDMGDFSWSYDSKWLAYSKGRPNNYNVIVLYSLASGKATPVTDGMTNDVEPVFSPDGKYLAFRSTRHFDIEFNSYDNEFIFPNAEGLYVLALAKDAPSPVAPESDEETPADDDKKSDDGKSGDKGDKGDKKDSDGDDDADSKAAAVKVDFEGIFQRVAEVPVDHGSIFATSYLDGKLLYLVQDPEAGGGEDEDEEGSSGATLEYFDFDERETVTVMEGVEGYLPTPDGEKLLVRTGKGWGIIEPDEDQKVKDMLAVDDIQVLIDPKAEYVQMFDEAWRLERDFFYDPRMHGVDWNEVRQRYSQLVPYATHRSDLNYLLGEMIAELNSSHAYVGGGDYPRVSRVGVGLLGADYELDAGSGRYKFKKIYGQSDWIGGTMAPLGAPGVNVREGDYLIGVNGREVRAPEDVYAAFQATADRPILLRVNDRPDTNGSRSYLVEPVGNEIPLRYEAWVTDNRKRVHDMTNGRVGYLHVPDTGVGGHVQLSRGLYAESDKDGLIVDGRFNSGGFIPDELVQRLARRPLSYWAQRHHRAFKTPGVAIGGPKVCVTNEYAGSGGDCLPYFFRELGLGPLVGKRTWGGLIGINRGINLIDGGNVTFPAFSFYNLKGEWVVEDHGVDMDYEVEQIPEEVMAGHDPQLEKAIELVNDALKKSPPVTPPPPVAPNRAGVRGDSR
ncbi:MAG TPA: S41 family peptidase [Candidatus Eisenbacteria bacterium]